MPKYLRYANISRINSFQRIRKVFAILSGIVDDCPQSGPQDTTSIISIVRSRSQGIISRCPRIGMLRVTKKYNPSLQINGQRAAAAGHLQYIGHTGRRIESSAYSIPVKQGAEIY